MPCDHRISISAIDTDHRHDLCDLIYDLCADLASEGWGHDWASCLSKTGEFSCAQESLLRTPVKIDKRLLVNRGVNWKELWFLSVRKFHQALFTEFSSSKYCLKAHVILTFATLRVWWLQNTEGWADRTNIFPSIQPTIYSRCGSGGLSYCKGEILLLFFSVWYRGNSRLLFGHRSGKGKRYLARFWKPSWL